MAAWDDDLARSIDLHQGKALAQNSKVDSILEYATTEKIIDIMQRHGWQNGCTLWMELTYIRKYHHMAVKAIQIINSRR